MSIKASAPDAPEWFGQPRGLTILFLTEMWDQFSFFGMRALLVLYMTKHLMIAQQKASWIYGLYAASVYFTPLAGGVIADRWLGRRASILLGGLIMAAGHFMMAFEGLFYVALTTIAVGNGLFLPSLPSQIDSLYAADDPRRKSAYNVYYVGINLGAFAAPMVVGTVGEAIGFHFGFALAGFGMLIAMGTYIAGGRYLPADPGPARPTITGGPGWHSFAPGRLALLLAVAAAVVVFRGAYEQLGNTLSLWADQAVDRGMARGVSIPVTWFQSLNPLVVFLFTPIVVSRWTHQAERGREPSSVSKMSAGAAIIAVAYLALALVAQALGRAPGGVPWPWLAGFLVLLTLGELYILPVGLGLFGRLAPEGLRATTIALWYSAGFFGNLLAGGLGSVWSSTRPSMFFALAAGVAGLASAALWLLRSTSRRAEQSS